MRISEAIRTVPMDVSAEPGFDVFARSFRTARERVPSLRVVFSDLPSTRAALAHLKLENLDRGILAGEFFEGQIVLWPRTDHFGSLRNGSRGEVELRTAR